MTNSNPKVVITLTDTYRIQGDKIIDTNILLVCDEQLSTECSDNEAGSEVTVFSDVNNNVQGCQTVGKTNPDQANNSIDNESVLAQEIRNNENLDENHSCENRIRDDKSVCFNKASNVKEDKVNRKPVDHDR